MHARCLGPVSFQSCTAMIHAHRPSWPAPMPFRLLLLKSTCSLSAVHYVGRLASSSEVFLDTKAESQSGEPVHLVAGRGACHPLLEKRMLESIDMMWWSLCCRWWTDCGQRDVGISLAVATMQKGERCRLRVQPQYGYGKQGACSGAPLASMHPSSMHVLCCLFTVTGLPQAHTTTGFLMLPMPPMPMQAAFRSPTCHQMRSWSMIWSLWTLRQ